MTKRDRHDTAELEPSDTETTEGTLTDAPPKPTQFTLDPELPLQMHGTFLVASFNNRIEAINTAAIGYIEKLAPTMGDPTQTVEACTVFFTGGGSLALPFPIVNILATITPPIDIP